MFKYILPSILIGISITLFFVFVNPLYSEVFNSKAIPVGGETETLQAKQDAFNKALDNSKELKKQKEILTKKYDDITQANKAKLERLVPDNVDNIRLILEIEKIAGPYGMVPKDVRYDSVAKGKENANKEVLAGGTDASQASKDYGTWNLEFTVEGTYANFLKFIRDLQSNLRIVDIISVQFSSDDTTKPNSSSSANATGAGADALHKYTIKIQTYWLKN